MPRIRGLNLNGLRCTSVLRSARHQHPSAVSSERLSDGEMIECTASSDVLYIPELGIQILADGSLPIEGIIEPWNLDHEKRSSFHGLFKRYKRTFTAGRYDEPVCVLANLYSRNFTHFIEELFKVIILERLGFEGKYLTSGLPRFTDEFLALLGIDGSRIERSISEPTVLREAYYPTNVHIGNISSYPSVLLELRRTLFGSIGSVSSPVSSRIWMERDSASEAQVRDLVNREEIEPLLKEYGFDRVDLADLPLREQLAISRDATVIAGIHGSAFAHTMFIRPRSTVIECFSPLYLNGSSYEICQVLDHDYRMIASRNASHEPYPYGTRVHVDPAQLQLALRGLDPPSSN